MKKLIYIFIALVAFAPLFAVPVALAADPNAPCSCICKPQTPTVTTVITGPGGAAAISTPNSCTPPADKIQIGMVESQNACGVACQAKCSNFESCTTVCSKNSDCDPGLVCGANALCVGAPAGSTAASPTTTEPSFKPIAPALSITIPNLSMPDFLNVTRSGNYYYIPFLSVYLSALFRLGLGVAAVLAVIMIMVGGFIWIAAAGDSGKIGAAKSMIANAAVGLFLTLGSFIFLQIVDPNLVNLQALQVKIVQPAAVDIEDDQISDMLDPAQFPTGPVTKPTWNAQTYICPPNYAIQPPTGVADPTTLVKLDCPNGIILAGSDSGGGRATAAVRNALCAAGVSADAAGYRIKVGSSYRPFTTQAELWCGRGATKYQDANTRKAYYAVPGFSNHGLGNAVDVVLIDKSTGKDLNGFDSKGQCNYNTDYVAKLATFMEDAGFSRYEAEIWHFEAGSSLPLRGPYKALPSKCPKK